MTGAVTVLVELESDWAVSLSSPTHNVTAGFRKGVGFAHPFFSPKMRGAEDKARSMYDSSLRFADT